MRFLLLVVLGAGCYGPRFTEGLPCSEEGNCPEGQRCDPATLICNPSASSDGGTDAPLPPDPTLVLALAFEEAASGIVADRSGYGNHAGFNVGTPMFEPVHHGNGISIDDNERLVIAPSASLDIGGSALTISLWLESGMPDSTSYGVILEKEVGPDGTYNKPFVQYSIEVSSDVLAAIISDSTTLSRCEFVLPAGLHHVAYTYNGEAFVGYVDGALATVNPAGCTNPPRTIAQRPTTPLVMGSNGVMDERFTGRIDNLRVYRRVLTAAEIITDMNTAIE